MDSHTPTVECIHISNAVLSEIISLFYKKEAPVHSTGFKKTAGKNHSWEHYQQSLHEVIEIQNTCREFISFSRREIASYTNISGGKATVIIEITLPDFSSPWVFATGESVISERIIVELNIYSLNSVAPVTTPFTAINNSNNVVPGHIHCVGRVSIESVFVSKLRIALTERVQ